MTHFKARVEIRQPVERVYSAFMDRALQPRWRSGLRSVENLSGDRGKPGSRQRLTFLHRGQETTLDETVIDVVENEACYFRLDHASMYSLTNIVFSERNGKTRVSSAVQVYGNGLPWRLLVPIMKGSLRRRQKANLNRFKALLEGTP
jgi:uncharacterized protein YndB with AHSA1/START domain